MDKQAPLNCGQTDKLTGEEFYSLLSENITFSYFLASFLCLPTYTIYMFMYSLFGSAYQLFDWQ